MSDSSLSDNDSKLDVLRAFLSELHAASDPAHTDLPARQAKFLRQEHGLAGES